MSEDEWREMAEDLLENENLLTSKEAEFLQDILDNWDGELTERQEEWLTAINDKVEAML